MTIDLSSDERRMILIALRCDQIKESIQAPATPRKIRDTYKALVERLVKDEKLHMDLDQSVGGRLIVPK